MPLVAFIMFLNQRSMASCQCHGGEVTVVTSHTTRCPRAFLRVQRDTKPCHLILFILLTNLTPNSPSPSNAFRPQTYITGAQNSKMPTTSTPYTHAANILKAFRPRIPRNLLHRLRRYLPQPRFLLFHWTYFITTCMVSSIIFWHFSTPHGNVTYVDSLFMITEAMTQAGLNTINPSSINTFQQCMLFGHIIIGNPIFISAFVVYVRKRAFHPRFKKAAKEKERNEKNNPSRSYHLAVFLHCKHRACRASEAHPSLRIKYFYISETAID